MIGFGLDHHADYPIGNLALTQQCYGHILMEFSGYLGNSTRNNLLKSWGDLDHYTNCPNRESEQCGDNNEVP